MFSLFGKRSMRVRAGFAAALMVLAVPGGGAAMAQGASNVNAAEWVIGPVIRGRNHSEGVPLHPTPRRGGGWQIDLPQRPSGVHYVTFPHGSLADKSRIVMRYR